MAEPGLTPPPEEAPGAVMYRQLLAGGAPQAGVDQYKAKLSAQMQAGGVKPEDVAKYWGDDAKAPPPSLANLATSTIGSLPPDKLAKIAADPLENFLAGMQDTGEGRLLRGGPPDIITPEHAALVPVIMNALGQAAGSLPSYFAGAAIGAPAGAAAGATIPVAGETGIPEAVGGAMGQGAGGMAGSQMFRQVVMDFQNGNIKDFGTMWGSITKAFYDARDAALTGAAMGPAGLIGKPIQKAVGAVGGNFIGKVAGKTASVGTQVAVAAYTGAALKGRLPTQEDFETGAAVMLGFEAFHAVGGRAVASEAANRVMTNLGRIWVHTGLSPKDAVARAQHDPVIRQEILAQDPGGNPVTPNIKVQAPGEPTPYNGPAEPKPSPTGAPVADTGFRWNPDLIKPETSPNITDRKSVEDDLGGHIAMSVDHLLPLFKSLEGSADDAVSPPQGMGSGGAIGRYQITPGTARQYNFDPARLKDPAYNTQAATAILTDLFHRYRGNLDDIALAYHSGEGTANKWIAAGRPLDPKVMGEYGMKYVLHERSLEGHPGKIDMTIPEAAVGSAESGPPRAEMPAEDLSRGEVNDRVDSIIGEKPDRLANTLKWDLDNLYSQWVSELGPAMSFDRLLDAEGARGIGDNGGPPIVPDSKLDKMNTEDNFRQTYASDLRAGFFAKYGTLSPAGLDASGRREIVQTSDDSFIKAYTLAKDAGGDRAGLDRYQLALRTIEKEGQGIHTNIRLDDAERIVKEDSVKYGPAAEMMTRVQDASLDYAREAGRFSSAQVDRIKRANMHYVTYAPIMGEKPIPGAGRNKFTPGTGPKKMEGGDYQIQDLMHARMQNVQMMIRDGDRNIAVGGVVRAMEANPELANTLGFREVKGGDLREITGGDQYSAQLREQGINEKNWDDVKALAQARNINWDKNSTRFPFYDDGKLRVFEVSDPEMAALFRGTDPKFTGAAITVLTELARLQRSGITLDPSYGLRMTLRHEVTSTIFDKNGGWYPYQDLLRGISHVVGNSDFYRKALANGAVGGAMSEMTTNYLDRDLDTIMEKTGTNNALWNTVRHPIQFAELISERVSAMARVGYAARMEPTLGILKASTGARTAKIDFAEKTSSALANTIAQATPFQRARVLGLKQQYEAVTQRPLMTAAKLIMFTAIPAAVFHVLNNMMDKSGAVPANEQYNQINRFERDTNFITPQIGGIRIKQLAPPGIATMVNAMVNRFLDNYLESDPHAYDKWGKTFLQEFSPASMPTLSVPLLEATTNSNFMSGHALIPDSMKAASGPMQYTNNTTAVARLLGKAIGMTPLDFKLSDATHTSSPIVLEQFVRDWAGTTGMAVLSALNYPLTGHFRSDDRTASVLDIPFVQSFFITHPSANPQTLSDFYTAYDTLQEAHADRVLATTRFMETGDPTEINRYGQNPAAYVNLANTMKSLHYQEIAIIATDHNDKLTIAEKRQNIASLSAAYVATAQAGLQFIDAINKGTP